MSNDPSKLEYACWNCNKLPCECKREHKTLTFERYECALCIQTFFTKNKLQEHNSYKHMTSLPEKEVKQTNEHSVYSFVIPEGYSELKEVIVRFPDLNGTSDKDLHGRL